MKLSDFVINFTGITAFIMQFAPEIDLVVKTFVGIAGAAFYLAGAYEKFKKKK